MTAQDSRTSTATIAATDAAWPVRLDVHVDHYPDGSTILTLDAGIAHLGAALTPKTRADLVAALTSGHADAG